VSADLTPDAVYDALVAGGTSPANARKMVAKKFGIAQPTAAVVEAPAMDPIAFPIRIVLPWTALCSDNIHERASLAMVGGKPVPRKVLDARYKAARDKTRKIARDVMRGRDPLSEPLALAARVYLPGGSHRNDAINFSKCAHDALQKIVFDNDRWLYDSRWIRAGIDVDAPRAEIDITLYRQAHTLTGTRE
jgi:hypothetical protein